MKRLGGILIAAMLAAPVVAQDEWSTPPPPWEGVWQGMIGGLPVHVCLNNTPYIENGAYYYDRVKKLIRLERDKDRDEWVEHDMRNQNRPRWHVSVVGGDITGTWADGKKSLSVRLKRIAGPSQDYPGPCGYMEFHRPRLSSIVTLEKPGAKDGARITNWAFKPGMPFENAEVSTFTLNRPSAGVAKINSLLRAVLPKADGSGEWLDCMAANANAHGTDGDYWESIEPTLITDRWLAVDHHNDSSCGGNHPNTANLSRTFDLARGIEVDPRDWFKPSAVLVKHYEPGDEPAKMLTDAFVSAILKGWKPEDPECDDPIRTQTFWNIGVARGALVFSPDLPRVVMACGEDFRIPFDRLQPYLNAKGKAAVASLPRR